MEQLLHSVGDSAVPWGYVIVFMITALEASAFVGLVVPGETALLLAGYLAYQGKISLAGVVLAAVIGGVAGDSAGYEVGRHFGEPLRRGWIGRKVGKDRWERSRAYVRRNGGKAILLGRFVGVLRALVPAVAGDSRMPYRRFLAWNVAGAVVWAPSIVVAGYLAGSSYEKVAHFLGRATLALLAIVVLSVLLVHQRHKSRERARAGVRE